MLFLLCKSLRLQCFNGQADATLLRLTGGNTRISFWISQSLPRYRWLEILRVAKFRRYVELWKNEKGYQWPVTKTLIICCIYMGLYYPSAQGLW